MVFKVKENVKKFHSGLLKDPLISTSLWSLKLKRMLKKNSFSPFEGYSYFRLCSLNGLITKFLNLKKIFLFSRAEDGDSTHYRGKRHSRTKSK